MFPTANQISQQFLFHADLAQANYDDPPVTIIDSQIASGLIVQASVRSNDTSAGQVECFLSDPYGARASLGVVDIPAAAGGSVSVTVNLLAALDSGLGGPIVLPSQWRLEMRLLAAPAVGYFEAVAILGVV